MAATDFIDRRESFEPDHTFVKVADKTTKEIWRCDGSCGINTCTEKRYFKK